jgi:signal transduction histidine kinase
MKYQFSIKFLVIFLLFFITVVVKAQVKNLQQKTDSLVLAYKNYPRQDSLKLVIVKKVYKQYMQLKNFDKVEEYVDETIKLANKLGQKKYVADAYYNRGLFYQGFTNYEKAIDNYEKGINFYIKIDNLDMVAGTYLNMGALYFTIPDYAKALEVNQKAIEIYQKNNNELDMASCFTNIASLYQELGQQANALAYLQKALKVFIKNGENTRGVAVVYNGIGSSYLQATDNELLKMNINPSQRNVYAVDYLTKALKIAQDLDDDGVQSTIYKDLGSVYENQGVKDLALQAYLKSIEFNKKGNDLVGSALCLLSLANFYENEKDYAKSKIALFVALKIGKENKLLEIQRNSYLRLSHIAEKEKDFNQSLIYFKQYIVFKDEIFNTEKEKEITRRRLQLDFGIKERDYQLKQKITDGDLQRQVLLAKQQQQELALQKQELALSDKEKTLQRFSFLKKQADLENEKRFQQEMLDQQQLKAKIKDNEIRLQRTELKFNRNINLFLSTLAVLLSAIALFIFYTQRKTAKLNRIVSEQKIELEKLGKVKDRIFSVVSHDMRTPVNSLISFIQLLDGGNISQEKLTKYAANLKNTLGYTSTMMENLLSWASSQMDGYNPIIEKFDLELCVKDVLNPLQIIANQKNINIENKIKSGILCFADMNMTTLVLRNIISNAIKFTPNGGIIKIDALANDKQVLVTIKDNGVGLSKPQVLRFNQSGNQETGETTLGTNKEKGTGIGLILCKTFTALMNGTLQVKSELNNGSTFTLTLPQSK